jgi:hypothetical protein
MTFRIVFFGVATLGLAVLAFILWNPRMLEGLGAGLLLGVLLALLGLHLTLFETTPEGKFYTPNTYIGLALSLLFFVRVIYRGLILFSHTPAFTDAQQPAALQSPLTNFMFALLAGYYIAYYTGILIRSHR